jgi:hypothetical protein
MKSLLCSFFVASGCSWIGMTSPPACEPHPALPIVDGVAAVAFAGLGAGIIAGTTDADYHVPAVVIVAVPALIIGTIYLASAIHGVDANRACRAGR